MKSNAIAWAILGLAMLAMSGMPSGSAAPQTVFEKCASGGAICFETDPCESYGICAPESECQGVCISICDLSDVLGSVSEMEADVECYEVQYDDTGDCRQIGGVNTVCATPGGFANRMGKAEHLCGDYVGDIPGDVYCYDITVSNTGSSIGAIKAVKVTGNHGQVDEIPYDGTASDSGWGWGKWKTLCDVAHAVTTDAQFGPKTRTGEVYCAN